MNSQQSQLLFEEEYLRRTLGNIVKKPDIAIIELVANAWDAGASVVEITIPREHERSEKYITISDNGEGLTDDEFKSRWMMLGYDRIRNQGSNVPDVNNIGVNRKTYGKNGQGRHGILCFNSKYTVSTAKNGVRNIYHINTAGNDALTIESNETEEANDGEHGTQLSVEVLENLPNITDISRKLSSKFLYDPGFKIIINGKSIHLEKEFDAIKKDTLTIESKIRLEVELIDTEKVKTKLDARGVAIWQEKRLVGKPSWVLGDKQIIDGRTRFASRFMVLVNTQDLGNYILPDWTGFKDEAIIDCVYDELFKLIRSWLDDIANESIDDLCASLKSEFEDEIIGLPRTSQNEIEEYTRAIATTTYGLPTKQRRGIISAFLKMQQSKPGCELLQKLLQLDVDDYVGLNSILDKWKVSDALQVLDLIDIRMKILETIQRCFSDKSTDELHVLHPLVSESRWIFGPEYESAEYVANVSLRKVMKNLFKVDVKPDAFQNSKKRPDIVVLNNDTTFSLTGTEWLDSESKLSYVKTTLIIELKKGGFTLGEDELNQIQHYILELENQEELNHVEKIEGYLVGYQINPRIANQRCIKYGSKSTVHIATYAELVSTAQYRLFALQKILSERYTTMDDKELHREIRDKGIVTFDDFKSSKSML